MDSAWRVKVGDFNLSKLMEASSSVSSTGGAMNPRWLVSGPPASRRAPAGSTSVATCLPTGPPACLDPCLTACHRLPARTPAFPPTRAAACVATPKAPENPAGQLPHP